MQNPQLARRPKYSLGSVDGVLQLLQLLRDEGPLRVATAADHLGVSRSTAHRLLGMLVYRGFAVQDENRVYQPGPGMNVPPVRTDAIRRFKRVSEPLFCGFAERMGETVSLVARFGATARFIETYVPFDGPTVTSRRGQILPARHTSAGKMLLSLLAEPALQQLYHSEVAERSGTRLSRSEFKAFAKELRGVRDLGYAMNREETETGIWALSMPFDSPAPGSWLAFAVAVPSVRSAILTQEPFLSACRAFQVEVDALSMPAGASH